MAISHSQSARLGASWVGFLCERSNHMQDWKAIEAQSQKDLDAIQTDQDAVRFIETYLSKELRHNYLELYRSDRHEMNRTPRQAIDNLLSLPPL